MQLIKTIHSTLARYISEEPGKAFPTVRSLWSKQKLGQAGQQMTSMMHERMPSMPQCR
jgi:hypothetical protein